jgi:hypothetical protein
VVGREFTFPFDFEYTPTPGITTNNAASVHEYLRLTGRHDQFAAEIFKLLLEEKRMIAREKVNEGRHIVVYNIGYIVTVKVQSNTSQNRVAKLSYKSKGPFFVKEVLGYGCYMLQRWNREDATLQKYHSSDMYLLLECLYPAEPLDTPDLQYINSLHGIVAHPLQQPLEIKLFKENGLPASYQQTSPCVNQYICRYHTMASRHNGSKGGPAEMAHP